MDPVTLALSQLKSLQPCWPSGSPVSGLYVVLTAPTPGASSAALSRKHVFMKYLYFYSEYVAFETNSSCSVSPKITSCPANGSCQSWKDLGLSFR